MLVIRRSKSISKLIKLIINSVFLEFVVLVVPLSSCVKEILIQRSFRIIIWSITATSAQISKDVNQLVNESQSKTKIQIFTLFKLYTK